MFGAIAAPQLQNRPVRRARGAEREGGEGGAEGSRRRPRLPRCVQGIYWSPADEKAGGGKGGGARQEGEHSGSRAVSARGCCPGTIQAERTPALARALSSGLGCGEGWAGARTRVAGRPPLCDRMNSRIQQATCCRIGEERSRRPAAAHRGCCHPGGGGSNLGATPNAIAWSAIEVSMSCYSRAGSSRRAEHRRSDPPFASNRTMQCKQYWDPCGVEHISSSPKAAERAFAALARRRSFWHWS